MEVTMPDWVNVARAAEFPDPSKRTVEVDDALVVLFHVGGKFSCIDDVCTHDGGPLGDGPLEDGQIVCPRHGARFDIRTGKALTMPATVDVRVHEVKVENGEVFVRLNPES
jgi:3-phenylpropionate/trans-cinnamate dioxygenase ferredoxin subunit